MNTTSGSTMPTNTNPTNTTKPNPQKANRPRVSSWLIPLARRIHFYAGILVAPFILLAALSGALYAFTPQLDRLVYAEVLTSDATAPQIPLDAQVQAANNYTEATPVAVRPAPHPGDTTRVMYADPALGTSKTRGVFVDPTNGEILGELTVYGSSGSLPLRTWVSDLHRNLHLGDLGRIYSELAASWLWIIALIGMVMWIHRARNIKKKKHLFVPNLNTKGYRGTHSKHLTVGIWLLIFMLFFSATGLTWSKYTGANISALRAELGWTQPKPETSLTETSHTADEHAEHSHHSSDSTNTTDPGQIIPASYDGILHAARLNGIDAAELEIKPATSADTAWLVQEIRRTHPHQVDARTIDPATYALVDAVNFSDYPLPAKLARWGIDLHMGIFFGWINALILFIASLGIAAMTIWGYLMWWQRRPRRASSHAERKQKMGTAPPRVRFKDVPLWFWAITLAITCLLGIYMPVFGSSLVALIALDLLLAARNRHGNEPV